MQQSLSRPVLTASLAAILALSLVFGLAACEGETGAPFGGGSGGDAAAGADTSGGGGGGPCTPACDGRVCGPDGCGGTCGAGCGAGQVCNAAGTCVAETCEAACAGKECGPDGCGDVCGVCSDGWACNAAGRCVDPACTPDCGGRECGDDGCAGTCGPCAAGSTCNAAGLCVPDTCAPACAGRECGSDGCGGLCGTCGAFEACEDGDCVSTVCVPDCAGLQCGPDPDCGQNCGTCGPGDACEGGQCECVPDCADRDCGDDGCGGSCGTCADDRSCNALGACIAPGCEPDCAGVSCGPDPVCGQACGGCEAGLVCIENTCACVPSCVGVACGTDGCGGSCGTCSDGLTCVESLCVCVPACAGRECGSNGCGGSCGSCGEGETCTAGLCEAATCTPSCAGRACGDNGCGGSCGDCDAGETCTAAGQCQGGGGGPVVDAPCTADGDCGAGGSCLDFDGFFPGGYCSVECSATECPDGSGCWSLGEDVGSYCLHTCTSSGECRDGYWCDNDNTCWPGEEPTGTRTVGGPCDSDADCDGGTCYPETSDGQPTGFVDGYCLIFDCSEQAPCPAGSECWGLTDGGTVCLDSCSTNADCRDGYACDDQACLPSCTADSCPAGTVCNQTSGLCEEAPCTPGSCPDGLECVDGRCVADIGTGPGAGPGPTCSNLPPLECQGTAAYCGQIVPFEPDTGPGYEDYAINGETMADEYRSYIRRDVMIAIQYAAAKTACKLGDWDFGNGGPVGLGDMSESSGHVPGWGETPFYCWDYYAENYGSACSTDDDCPANLPYCHGQLGHPVGTHESGFDMDIGYFQVGTADNRLRPICNHVSGGSDQYHCVAEPHLLDPWRTALFIAFLAEHPQIRVVGVDGQAGPIIDSALTQLCTDDWTPGVASCGSPAWSDFPVTYETTNGGAGWYYFHHHHFHISFSAPGNKSSFEPPSYCLTPECEDVSVLPLSRYDLRGPRGLPRLSRDRVVRP